jgi:predicted site-specific integrase-resolvase
MIAFQPNVCESARYSINETCQILEIHRNTLRAYTFAGNIKCGVRRATKRKFYTGTEIIRLWKSQC